MKITPLDIRKKQFEKKTFGGYDTEEVDTFLSVLSKEWERTQTELRKAGDRLKKQEEELSRLKDVESSFFKTLKTVETSGEQARKEAEISKKEAHVEAEKVISDAEKRAQEVSQTAGEKVLHMVENAEKELQNMESKYQALEDKRNQNLISLRNLLNDILKNLDGWEGNKEDDKFPSELKKTKDSLEELKNISSRGDNKSLGDGAKEDVFSNFPEKEGEVSFFDEIT
ncbi:MAG: DivIVA domain-containing protein [Cytophagales bacterium]|nr:DivIVA domain-containing protein [Cytophagales bacterium]